jgi:hypothetical protein
MILLNERDVEPESSHPSLVALLIVLVHEYHRSSNGSY